MLYKFYAGRLGDFTKAEINSGEAGEIVEFDVTVPRHFEQADEAEVSVTVVAPKGYELTQRDYANIGELVDAD
jgi:hypothetical protein